MINEIFPPLTDTIYPRSQSVSYVIDGNPIPLARARHGKGKVWDAQKQIKMFYRVNLDRLHNNRPFFEPPFHVSANFYMPMAQCHHKRWDQMVDTYHIFKPDTSNILKFMEDIGTGILYKDDCMIAHIWTKKIYAKKPRTEFIITEMRND